jgi:RHS repeat-associated protein/uncharacterized repeat protein (TIGR01451 family)
MQRPKRGNVLYLLVALSVLFSQAGFVSLAPPPLALSPAARSTGTAVGPGAQLAIRAPAGAGPARLAHSARPAATATTPSPVSSQAPGPASSGSDAPALAGRPSPGTAAGRPAATPVPSGGQPTLGFGVWVDPLIVDPGETVTYTVAISNPGAGTMAGVVLSGTLPAALVPVAARGHGFGPARRGRGFIWQLAGLAPGQTVTGTFQALVPAEASTGHAITTTLNALVSQPAGRFSASAAVYVRPTAEVTQWVVRGAGQRLSLRHGLMALEVPRTALTGTTRIDYRPLPNLPGIPGRHPFAFELDATDQAGRALHTFTRPLTLTLAYTPSYPAPYVAEVPRLYYFDPAAHRWTLMPGTYAAVGGQLTVSLGHFSDFAYGNAEAVVDQVSSVRGAQTDLFTRSIGYSYDFELPPGPGGLTPKLGLSYSSSDHLPATGYYSKVGYGWQLAGADFVYIPPNGTEARASLYLNGTTYTLVECAATACVGGQSWFAQEDPSIKITATTNWAGAVDAMYVYTPDGLTYDFEPTVSDALPNELSDTGEYYYQNCNGWYGQQYRYYIRLPLRHIWDNLGNEIDYLWEPQTQGEDVPAGSPYNPVWETGSCGQIHTYESRLKYIKYDNPGHTGQDSDDRVEIELGYAGSPSNPGRGDQPAEACTQWDMNTKDAQGKTPCPKFPDPCTNCFYSTSVLTGVTVTVTSTEASQQQAPAWDIVRSYGLTYTGVITAGDGSGRMLPVLLLTSVTECGATSSSGGPAAACTPGSAGALPSTDVWYGPGGSFGYEDNDVDPDHPDSFDPSHYSMIYSIRNNYGGSVVFNSTTHNNTTPVNRAITLDSRTEDNGLGSRQTWSYWLPSSDWYSSESSDWVSTGYSSTYPFLSLAQGFRAVTVTLPTGDVEVHHFDVLTQISRPVSDTGSTVPWKWSDALAGRETEVDVWNAGVAPSAEPVSKVTTNWASTVGDVDGLGNLAWATLAGCQTQSPWCNLDFIPLGGASDLTKWPPQEPRFAYKTGSETYRDGQAVAKATYYYTASLQGGLQYGNETGETDFTGSGPDTNPSWTEARHTIRQYYPQSTSAWIVQGKPAWTALYGPDAQGGHLASQTFYDYDRYDPPDAHGNIQSSADPTPPLRGLLHQKVEGWPAGQDPGSPITPKQASSKYAYWQTNGLDNGNPKSVTDANGNTTTTYYDGALDAYPVCTVDALGHVTRQAYYGVTEGAQDPADPSVSAKCSGSAGDPAWDAGGNPVAGAAFGQLERDTDANGQATTYSYDQWGRPVGEWRPEDDPSSGAAATQVMAYSVQGPTPSLPFYIDEQQRVDAGGSESPTYQNVWTYYDGFGQAVQTQTQAESDALSVVSTGYDAFGHVLTQTMPFTGAVSGGNYQYLSALPPLKTYAYDALGRTTSTTNADGTVARNTYSVQTTQICDANYHRKDQLLDGLGRLVQVVEYAGGDCGAPTSPAATNYGYDAADRLTGVTDAANDVTSIQYDALGHKVSMTDPDLGSWSYTYDAVGNLLAQTDARKQTTCLYYDALNRMLGKYYPPLNSSRCQAPPGYQVAYAYDQGANGIGLRSAAAVSAKPNASTGAQGDCVGWSGSNCTNWSYDQRGRLASEQRHFTDYPGDPPLTTSYTYDDAGQAATTTYPDDEAVAATYTTRGLPLTLSGSAGTLVSAASYDMAGRLLGESFPAGGGLSRTQSYYSWTQQGGALQWIQVGGAAGTLLNLSYTYDAAGNLTSLTDLPPSSASGDAGAGGGTGSSFPVAWTAASDPASGVASCSLQYQLDGGPWASWQDCTAPGSATFTQAGPDDSVSFRTLATDRAGNSLTTLAPYGKAPAKSAFSYDALDRLTSAYGSSYAYDALGREISQTTPSGETLVYSPAAGHVHAAGQVAHAGGGSDSYSYDADGNLTATTLAGGRAETMTWDAENRLVGAPGEQYVYDGDGQWVEKIVGAGSGTVYTFYVGPQYELQVGAGQAVSVTKYYYFGSQRVAERQPDGTLAYLHADHLGSVLLATDVNGGVVGNNQVRYDAYGNQLYGTLSLLPTDFDFTGQKRDGLSTGFYQMGARWYDPYIDQWIEPDSIVPDPGKPQSLNRYSYSNSNPLRYTDPSGHDPGCAVLGLGGPEAVVACEIVSEAVSYWPQIQALAADAAQVATSQGSSALQYLQQLDAAGKQGGSNPDNGGNTGGLDPNDPFKDASESIQKGVQTLRSQINNPDNYTTGRYGAEAHLSRAEYYMRQGTLEAVNPTGPGSIDLVLKDNVGVEVKYWSAQYLTDNVEGLAKQLRGFGPLQLRQITVEFVETSSEKPVTNSMLASLRDQLVTQFSIDLSNVTFTTVPNPGIPGSGN